MTDEKVEEISSRYIELYEKVTGEEFKPRDYNDVIRTIEQNILKSIK